MKKQDLGGTWNQMIELIEDISYSFKLCTNKHDTRVLDKLLVEPFVLGKVNNKNPSYILSTSAS